MSDQILTKRGYEFRFNDYVIIESLIGVSDEDRVGRLVQVRKCCGQFGSDVFLVRLANGKLATFENVMILPASCAAKREGFYTCMAPPKIPGQGVCDSDSTDTEYSIEQSYPETGFIIESPSQPETPGSSFAITITNKGGDA